MKEKHPRRKYVHLVKLVSKMYKALPEKRKREYKKKYDRKLAKYHLEMKEFVEKNSRLPGKESQSSSESSESEDTDLDNSLSVSRSRSKSVSNKKTIKRNRK